MSSTFRIWGEKAPSIGSSELSLHINKQFGSYENWKNDFEAVGGMRGVGWVICYHDPVANRLLNMWIDQHDVAHLAGCTPLLIMDVFEHAFLLDYGLKKKDYIDAFFENIDWNEVTTRFGKPTERMKR